MLSKIKNKITSLDSYLITCNDFKGGIENFFDYIRNEREILKTFDLNKIIEDFLVFSDGIEIDIKELIKFYSLISSLLYLKTQILYPVKLKNKRLAEKEIIRKLITFSEKYKSSKVKRNLKGGIISGSKKSFFEGINVFSECVDNALNCRFKVKEFKSRIGVVKKDKNCDDILDDKFRVKIIPSIYDSRILDKKIKIISILKKENSFIFEILLDSDDKYYFFKRFCYFLIALEYKMSNIVDLVYINGKLILKKGKDIDKYEQQRA
ncbi:hypothetical protein [Candidatus Borreliella tachyglossi]|uniref:hypothetical protein n=1 Tax=Candidatus Borreliella tachyglossi TaxID=1964448 RepID=UPI0018FF33B7|nr:hypothetical protein [Candidatus Borreliella tachyglossi]